MKLQMTQDAETQSARVLKKCQKMTEAIYTHEVIIPLFKAMGYESVDHYGGVYEGGKDLICWKTDIFGEKELTVVQIKRTNASAAASSSHSFSEITSQLAQAKEEKVPFPDGLKRRPNNVIFITPFEINTRVLESRFEGYSALRNVGVRVFDGSRIVQLLMQYLPEIADKLAGSDFVIQKTLLSNISNEDLLSALNYSREKNISDFYCDLDFGVGKVTTKFFFSLIFSPQSFSHSIDPTIWPVYLPVIIRAKEILCDGFLSPNLETIQENYLDAFKKWRSTKNQSNIKQSEALSKSIANDIQSFYSEFIELSGKALGSYSAWEIGKRNTSNETNVAQLPTSITARYSQQRIAAGKLQEKCIDQLTRFNSSVVEIKNLTNSIELIIKGITEIHEESIAFGVKDLTALDSLIQALGRVNKQLNKLARLFENTYKDPRYEFTINGEILADSLNQKQRWLSEQTKHIFSISGNKEKILNFFSECQRLFDGVGKVLDNPIFATAIGISESQKYANITEVRDRISMPIKHVFSTGIHCAVFGEAGAGKSTTLRMFAENAAKSDGEQNLTLFLPLNRIFPGNSPQNELEAPSLQKFEDGLSEFLRSSGRVINRANLVDFLKSKENVVFIFDGVDEIIKSSPWIIEAIESIESSYTNCQIILSSRLSGAYVDRINYLSLTLLPFSEQQTSEFIRGWFKENFEKQKLVETHLSSTPEIREIVRSPLLATILCVLAENDVPLPNSEVNMYRDRLELLLGHYDVHKKTRRIKSNHLLLETIVRKTAFLLHTRNTRSASIQTIEDEMYLKLGEKSQGYTKETIITAIHELVDPCNVLVPMTENGELGFGHLRYQEYSAAEELRHNRGIPVASYLANSWWKSVLVLFARMTDDIEHVIASALEKQTNLERFEETLRAMIETRPEREQRYLVNELNKHLRLDETNDDLLEFYESDRNLSQW
jgi:ABC-type lipoprotein export system ATPase subunit